jgi:V/A-type H+-transporting ATPase subunit F
MKILIIGNQDAVMGFELVGVHGRVASTEAGVHQALDEALADPDTGIVMITEDVARWARQRIDRLKVRSTQPVVLEIPGPEGPDPQRPSLDEVIRRTTGVKV